MSQIKPFKAFRPKPVVASALASVPYDVINTAEAAQAGGGQPRLLPSCVPA